MKTMIATASLTLCLLGLAIGASAQEQLNFSQLPLLDIPSPMPMGYGQLNWENFFYVNPATWSGAGPGGRCTRLGVHRSLHSREAASALGIR